MDIKKLIEKEFFKENELTNNYKKAMPIKSDSFSIDPFLNNLSNYEKNNKQKHNSYQQKVKQSEDIYNARLSDEEKYARDEAIYQRALKEKEEGKLTPAYHDFRKIPHHKDAKQLGDALENTINAIYREAVELYEKKKFDEAAEKFKSIDPWLKSGTYLANYVSDKSKYEKDEAIYQQALKEKEEGKLTPAYNDFRKIPHHKDAKQLGDMLEDTINSIYNEAVQLYGQNKFDEAAERFRSIDPWLKSSKYLANCESDKSKYHNKQEAYAQAVSLFESKSYLQALNTFNAIDPFLDSKKYIAECTKYLDAVYDKGKDLLYNKKYKQCIAVLSEISSYKDSNKLINEAERLIQKRKKKTIIVILSIFASLVVIAALLLTFFVFIPKVKEMKYNKSIDNINSGNYQEAAKTLKDLNYLDSKKQYYIASAGVYFEEGDYNNGLQAMCDGEGITTITYDPNGGTFARQSETITTYHPVPENCIKDYCDFVKWDVADFTIQTGNDQATCNLKLRANYTWTKYQITYVLNGGVNSSGNPTEYTYNTETITLKNPIKVGNTFAGWTSNGQTISQIKRGSYGDLTLTANWSINSYDVTLISNDTSKGSVSGQGSYQYGSRVTIKATPASDCMFNGWFKDANMREKVSENASYTFILEDANVTLYAKFVSQKEYQWNLVHGVIPNYTSGQIRYGMYPQSVVSSSATISALNSLSSSNEINWYFYNDEYYVKQYADPYGSYYFDNDSYIYNDYYWFKCEPLYWDILDMDGSQYYLLSSVVIDCLPYYTSRSSRYVGGKTIYANNYQYSTVRAWLNGYDGSSYGVSDYSPSYRNFFARAFYFDSSAVLTTSVDNSASTTTSSDNIYTCDNTKDKVFLPSYKDYTSYNYGFINSQDSTSTRSCSATDFAKAQGVVMNTNSYYGCSPYWTRSPKKSEEDYAIYCNANGAMYASFVSEEVAGIRPSIKIDSSKIEVA